ncbi:MAG: mechanosensitive ion channel [Gemmatimonadota bacterium]
MFILIIWLATWVGRIIRTFLSSDLLPRMSVAPGQADAWATLAQWAILVGGILFAAASAGIGGSQLAVLAGALGVGIGFGLQNIVNNFVSGFILIFEQPIKVGDKIEISSLGLLGEVRRIGIRSSSIHTFDGADVVVPNSNLIQSELVNWTLSDSKRRFQVEVGVKYGTDPQRVIDLLLEVAAEHPKVLKYPTPTALFMGFGDSSLNFKLNIWSATFEDFFGLRSEVNVLVNDRLKAEGIEIPFPQRDLHLRSVDAEAGRAVSAGSGTSDATPEWTGEDSGGDSPADPQP